MHNAISKVSSYTIPHELLKYSIEHINENIESQKEQLPTCVILFVRCDVLYPGKVSTTFQSHCYRHNKLAMVHLKALVGKCTGPHKNTLVFNFSSLFSSVFLLSLSHEQVFEELIKVILTRLFLFNLEGLFPYLWRFLLIFCLFLSFSGRLYVLIFRLTARRGGASGLITIPSRASLLVFLLSPPTVGRLSLFRLFGHFLSFVVVIQFVRTIWAQPGQKQKVYKMSWLKKCMCKKQDCLGVRFDHRQCP